MTEEQIIQKLQILKQIKPNADWSFSVKAQILKPTIWQTLSTILGLSPQLKLAYAFSVLLIAVVGALGFTQHAVPGDNGAFVSGTISQAAVKESVQAFKQSPKNLAVAKSLAQAIQENPTKAKDIALELKQDGTLAALSDGSDVTTKETSHIVYRPLVEQLLKDEIGTTSTEARQKIIAEAKIFYEKGEFGEALILLVNN